MYFLLDMSGFQDNKKAESVALASPTLTPIETVDEEQALIVNEEEEEILPENWLSYDNTEYGFSISYPNNYKALDDSENLYGWPNAVVLLYGGGQSYDIVVEAWDSKAEYESKYPSEELVVSKIGDKYITVADITKESENTEIIESFWVK